MAEIYEPFFVTMSRDKLLGVVTTKPLPDNSGSLSTDAEGFVAAYDRAIKEAEERGRKQGYAAAYRDVAVYVHEVATRLIEDSP